MEILDIKDEDDGSCIMDCNFDEREVDFFLNHAVNDILKKEVKRRQWSWENIKNIIRRTAPD